MANAKVVITGAAGLVGQNLIPRLKSAGFPDIVAIDKNTANTRILRRLHPDITIIEADLAQDDGWQHALANTGTLVCAHAQLNGLNWNLFERNNIIATQRLLTAASQKHVRYLVHISSASVNSKASDFYSESKRAQEMLAKALSFPIVVLRPTLMFGRGDFKNLGWLARFMTKTPLFPIPSGGRFSRQPLYVNDFCNVIVACMQNRISGVYNISGLTKVDYIDLVGMIKNALRLNTRVLTIPYEAFWLLLKLYGVIDRSPPFTTDQLRAFTAADEFELIDWPKIFEVIPTPLGQAIAETFQHSSSA
jgi:nucleoside-diphosphate-sugar epimerase